MAPLISLVMTTYNRERYLEAAIESVLQQTFTDFELLLWDDGSDDRSVAIADSYAQRDQRVRVVAAAHRGRVAALQAAIAHTTGIYLGWVDSDDLLAPTALEQTVQTLEEQPQAGMVYTDYLDIDEQGTVIRYGQRCGIPYSKDRLLLDFMTFHFRLMRRSIFNQVGGISGALDYVEDYDLCLRLSEVTEIRRVREPLYYYRNHASSASQQWRLEQVLRSKAAIAQALKRRGLADQLAIEVQLPEGHFFLHRKGAPTPATPSFVTKMSSLLASLPLLGAITGMPAHAQSITAAPDSTNTSVILNGDRYDISGGTQAGSNLFQSFQRFGLSASETATFLANPQIQNILGRVVGGEASLINGQIQVTGSNANLFLLNPAGIIFGANASLNVPGSFTATTANGIGFGNGWFNAIGTNDYAALIEAPDTFAFTANAPGAIVNAGTLTVSNGQSLALLGGTVVNTGQLTAPGGQIVITAVPGQNLVRLSQPGNLLSLEFQPLSTTTSTPNASPFAPLSLAQLLTGSGSGNATGLTANPDGTVQLTGSGIQIPTTPGTTIASGSLNAADQLGGNVRVLGNQVALVGATVNASGAAAGGTVQIGGNYQGNGVLPNAAQTFISQDSTINVDAGAVGNGGRAIVWADQNTAFGGTISARGGSTIGNGGFVEVSGKQNLLFRGTVDTSATNGTNGTLLLDPADITILPDGPPMGFSGQVLFGDAEPTTIFQNQLQELSGDTTILIQATNSISFAPLTTGALEFQPGNGSITFQAGGPITMTATDTIRAEGRSVTFIGGSLSLGNIDTSAIS
ncbi:MAG TPA: glycosyltransferase, partial [Thermosynechococcaceae cyanobacterium]